jgi:hypothetical protein
MLGWMAVASMNASYDQIGDPLIGHLAEHTMRYLAVATVTLFSGVALVVVRVGSRGRARRDTAMPSDHPIGSTREAVR